MTGRDAMTWTTELTQTGLWPTDLVPLLHSLGVGGVYVQRAERANSFQGGQVNDEARTLTRPAREEHRRRGYGFWEDVLGNIGIVSPETRDAIMTRAIGHDTSVEEPQRMTLSQFETACREEDFTNLADRAIVSFCSTVDTDQGQMHLPMLDLQTSDLDLGMAVARTLDLPGLLIASGKSFHLFGQRLRTQPELMQLLGRAQLLNPLTDARWAAHQIINGYAALRISTESHRHHPVGLLAARYVQ